ncbi:MAG: DUF4252 domain-containing protein [Acidobacteriota bacterium]
MGKKIAILGIALLLTGAFTLAAQEPILEEHPGYVPLDELALMPRDTLSLEINLTGPLLALVAGATRQEDPEFSDMVAGLLAIRVHVGPIADGVGRRVDRAREWLDDNGWQAIVRMRDGRDQTYIYLKQDGKDFVGLTLVAAGEDDEAVLVNVVGRVDPQRLGALAGRFDIPGLDEIPVEDPSSEETP